MISHLRIILLSILFTPLHLFAEIQFSDFTGLSCQQVLSEPTKRTESDIKSLKFLSFNTADLFEEVALVRARIADTSKPPLPEVALQDYQRKLVKLREQNRIIKQSDGDIVLLTEVSSLNGLDGGLAPEVKAKYRPFFFPTNDPRGMSMVILVKKDLPWHLQVTSRHEQTWFDPITREQAPLFSRNLPQIEFFRISPEGGVEENPLFVYFGNHAKSQRPRDGDPRSVVWRTAQYAAINNIVTEYERRGIATFLAGDFNVSLDDENTTRELAGLSRTLVGVLSPHPRPRWTHSFHQLVREPRGSGRRENRRELPAVYNRLDEIMISPRLLRDVIMADVILYRDENGRPITERPETYEQRNALQPSDHRPVFLELSTHLLFQRR